MAPNNDKDEDEMKGDPNGATKTKDPTEKSTTSSSKSSLILCGVVALLAFVAGLWTPSFLANKGASESRKLNSISPSVCDEEALSHFLHQEAVAGMHVICAEKSENDSLKLKLFAGAQETTAPLTVASNNSWTGIRDALENNLHLKPQDELHQPWAIFSSVGERLVDEDVSDDRPDVVDTLVSSGLVLLFEGGQWIWPGVRVGFKRTIDLYSIMPGSKPSIDLPEKTTTTLETLSLKPLVFSVENFLTEEECDRVQAAALPTMRHSSVSFTDADRGKDASEFRTSSNTFISATDDMLKDLDYRTASLTRVPRSHQESVQVLRYEKTEHYVAHHDYFNPMFYSKDKATLRLIENGRKNRMSTVFWYLSDVAKGGETVFPRWNGGPQPSDFHDCTVGLKVKPQRGKVVIFYSLTADGEMDPYSLHGACPVEEGVKWGANKWCWNLPMKYIYDA